MAFVREVTELVERRESWRAEIAGYLVGIDRRADGHTDVWVSAPSRDPHPRAVVRCAPTCVADLERLADVLPELLRAAATALRTDGFDDLRSTVEVQIDEHRALIAEALARRPRGPARAEGTD